MNALIDHLRGDINKVDDPHFKAMFETAAEVPGGLVKAFTHYEQKSEAAWKKPDGVAPTVVEISRLHAGVPACATAPRE